MTVENLKMIKEIPVNKYLNLIRKATPADLTLRKKYMKQQGVAEVINPMTANTSGAGAGMTASYQARENQPIIDYMEEARS